MKGGYYFSMQILRLMEQSQLLLLNNLPSAIDPKYQNWYVKPFFIPLMDEVRDMIENGIPGFYVFFDRYIRTDEELILFGYPPKDFQKDGLNPFCYLVVGSKENRTAMKRESAEEIYKKALSMRDKSIWVLTELLYIEDADYGNVQEWKD